MKGFTLGYLAKHVNGRLAGDPDVEIKWIATLKDARSGDISFLANRQYARYLPGTGATAVILQEKDLANCPTHAIVVDDPYLAYAKIAQKIVGVVSEQVPSGVSEQAYIDSSAEISPQASIGAFAVICAGAVIESGVQIGAHAYVGREVRIMKGANVYPHVTLYDGTIIGQRSIIHSGVVIGSDGFGIAMDRSSGRWIKVPQVGRVLIGNDVEIGANTTIDRGAIGDTVIEDNVKLDNQIQVGHNVQIGESTAIAGCVGIAGSTKIGKHCLIGGGAGIAGHIELVDNVVVSGMTMVTKSILKPGMYSSGMPARENRQWRKNLARFNNLERILKTQTKQEDHD